MFKLSESVSRESANFSRLGSSMLLDAMLLDATGCYLHVVDLGRLCRRSMFKTFEKLWLGEHCWDSQVS